MDPEFNSALAEFAKADVHVRERLVTMLEQTSPAINLDKLADRVVKEVDYPRKSLRRLLNYLGPIVVNIAEIEDKRPLSDVLLNFARRKNEVAGDQSIKDHLTRLLAAERTLGVTSKAQDIMWGHGRVFSDSRVITQVRPVFLSDPSAEVENAVIVHELQLDYREGGRTESICISMDLEQVAALVNALKRAEKKDRTLKAKKSFNYLFGG